MKCIGVSRVTDCDIHSEARELNWDSFFNDLIELESSLSDLPCPPACVTIAFWLSSNM
jgi:hypothetical protein